MSGLVVFSDVFQHDATVGHVVHEEKGVVTHRCTVLSCFSRGLMYFLTTGSQLPHFQISNIIKGVAYHHSLLALCGSLFSTPILAIITPFDISLNLMGILQSSKPSPSGPQSLSYTQAKQLAFQTKEHLTALRQELRLDLRFDTGSLRYNQRDWRKSTVQAVLNEGGEVRVVLDLEQLYRLAEMLRHLKKTKPTETPTPSSTPQQERECCICFAEKATTVLPCTHCFCATCTSRYIIEQQQHKCPTCRTQFLGGRDTLKRSFYQLIEEDREVYEEARGVVLEMLSKYNTRVVRAIVHMEEGKN